jgi:hypothetical protein
MGGPRRRPAVRGAGFCRLVLPETSRNDPAPTPCIEPPIADCDARDNAPAIECHGRHWRACNLSNASACGGGPGMEALRPCQCVEPSTRTKPGSLAFRLRSQHVRARPLQWPQCPKLGAVQRVDAFNPAGWHRSHRGGLERRRNTIQPRVGAEGRNFRWYYRGRHLRRRSARSSRVYQ